MDARKEKILQAIIEDYIKTAEPIGSRSIARKYNLGISPATIRNEMADLEDEGFLEQPHTSAGRIPSDKGYRYFVDNLMEVDSLAVDDEKQIMGQYTKGRREINSIAQDTAKILSQMTKYTSIVLAPEIGRSYFRNITLVPLTPETILMVMVTDTGITENKLIDIKEEMSPVELWKISQVFNAKLSGQNMRQLQRSLLREIRNEVSAYRNFLDQAIDVLTQTIDSNPSEKFFLGGTLNFLNQPEFKDLEKVKKFFQLFENDQAVYKLMEGPEKSNAADIKIGKENNIREIQDCSVVTSSYSIGGRMIGKIGVIGPTRMEYNKAITIVKFLADSLSEHLDDIYKK